MTLVRHNRPRPPPPAARREGAFLVRVNALEAAVSPPPVVGETTSWCRRVARGLTRLEAKLAERRRRHDELREELAGQEAVELERLERTAEGEVQLGIQLAGIRRRLGTLLAIDERGGFDEPYQEAKQIRFALLAWCVAARTIDAEIRSCVMETYYHDHGTVD